MNHRPVLVLSSLSLLAVVERIILDYRFVPELAFSAEGTVASSTFYLVMIAIWIWSLLETSHGKRRGLIAGLVVNAIVFLLIGLGTTLYWCPTPCMTVWPWMELSNWLNNVTAAAAVVVSVRALKVR